MYEEYARLTRELWLAYSVYSQADSLPNPNQLEQEVATLAYLEWQDMAAQRRELTSQQDLSVVMQWHTRYTQEN